MLGEDAGCFATITVATFYLLTTNTGEFWRWLQTRSQKHW